MRIELHTYTKDINALKLQSELNASDIASLINSFDSEPDISKLEIWTNTVLSTPEKVILDALVAAHDPNDSVNIPSPEYALPSSTAQVSTYNAGTPNPGDILIAVNSSSAAWGPQPDTNHKIETNGSLHALATHLTPGFFSPEEKGKLAGLQPGVSPNLQLLGVNITSFSDTNFFDLNFTGVLGNNRPDVIEFNPGAPNVIIIKSAGVYELKYRLNGIHPTARHGMETRVIKNAITPLPETRCFTSEYQNEYTNVVVSTLVNLEANDYLSLQVRSIQGTNNLADSPYFSIVKLEGIQGAKGDPGPVSEHVNILNSTSGSTSSQTYTDILNITPTGISNGTYKISVKLQYGYSATNSDLRIGLFLNNSLIPESEVIDRVYKSGTVYRIMHVDFTTQDIIAGVSNISLRVRGTGGTFYYYGRQILMEKIA